MPERNFVLIPEPQYKQNCQCFYWLRIFKTKETKQNKTGYIDHWNRKESPGGGRGWEHKPMVNSMTRGAKLYKTGKMVFLTSSVGKIGEIHVKMKLEHFLTPYTKINSTWTKCKTKYCKTFKGKHKNTLWHKSKHFFQLIFQGNWNKNKNKQMGSN